MVMKTFDFRDREGGLIADADGFTLLDNEWSDLNNVRIRNRAVSKIAGEQTLLNLDNTPVHSVFLNGYSNGKLYYYIADDGTVHRVNAIGTETEVTKGVGGTKEPLTTGVPYQMSPINGGYALLLNDANRTPQYITTVGSGTDTTEFTDIPGWDYSDDFSNVTAKIIRPFKYVMVAAGITQTDTDNLVHRNAGTIRVSNQAAPGALPTWNPNLDSADTADEFELSENGEIVDMVSLGDTLMIFTEDDIYGLRLTASTNTPVVVSKQLSGRGMLTQDCAVEFFGKLFVVGKEDIYTFQGGAATLSVSDGRVRDYFFDNLNSTYYDRTFTVHNERYDEIWVCFPNGDSTGNCNEALIWNYTYNRWTKRDLPNVRTGSSGPSINSNVFDFSDYHLMLPTNGDSIKEMDVGNTFSGNAITAYVERRGIDLAPESPGLSKWNSGIYFLITGTGDVTIKVRATDTPGRPVDFSATNDKFLKTRVFNIDGDMSDLEIEPRINGKFFNIRIESTGADDEWHLHRYVAEFEASDQRSN